MDIRSIFIGFFFGIVGAFFGSWFSYLFGECRRRKEQFDNAAIIFRSKTINALVGIYPVTRSYWDESLFPKFQQSVPIIETAGAEFWYFIKRKTELDAAIKDYRDYCQQRKYEKGAPHMTYPNSPVPLKPETNPIEEFKSIVEHLLSFADDK